MIDRRKFLKITSAGSLGLGLLKGSASALQKIVEDKNEHFSGFRESERNNLLATKPYRTDHIWSANELWERSISEGMNLVDGAVELDDHLLVEDDAPGIGAIQSEAWETIEKGVFLRKKLRIDRWPVREALLVMMVYPQRPEEPYSGAKLQVRVNGNASLEYEVGHMWTSFLLPTSQLRPGENRIEVTVPDDKTSFRMPVALASNYRFGSLSRSVPKPQRSHKSSDGGRTWSEGLGASEGRNGEYPIRLKLRGYRDKGWLQTPVIDLSSMEEPLRYPVSIEDSHVELENAVPSESNLTVYLRSGDKHRVEAGEWSDWSPLEESTLPSVMRKRFIQLRFEAVSATGDATPRINGLRVTSRVRPLTTGARNQIYLIRAVNRPLIDSPHEFPHEDPTHEELQSFRQRYDLDRIVNGARTDLELIMLLRGWAARQWEWFLPDADSESFIEWDARNILVDDPELGGFCLYYGIIFAQACQSFGIPVRMVTINYSVWGGHEVAEVWSRDYNKWIMVDPQFDTTFYSTETGKPLDVLELHEVFLQTYYPDGEVIDRDTWTIEDRDRRSHKIDPANLPIHMEIGGNALSGTLGEDYVWWKVTEGPAPGYAGGYGFFNTAFVRWFPRSNWLSQPLPIPVTHGRTHWGWDGYLAWADRQTPETPEHRNFVRKKSDMYARLYTVDFSAEPDGVGNLLIHMVTHSPGFSHYEISDNGRTIQDSGPTFSWELAPGLNTMTIRTVDLKGNRGPISELVVSFMPV